MKLFKKKMLAWWQVGILKLAVFSLGIAVGAQFSAALLAFVPYLLAVTLLLSLYLIYLWLQD